MLLRMEKTRESNLNTQQEEVLRKEFNILFIGLTPQKIPYYWIP